MQVQAHPMAAGSNNTLINRCLDSTLSVELAGFVKLSSTFSPILYSICFINGFSSVLATIANSLVLLVILKHSALRTQSNILLFSLALTDVLVGLVVQPSFVIFLAGKVHFTFYCAALLTYLYTEIFCVGLSLITLSLVACERFFAIIYPFKYISYVTESRLVKVVSLVWALWMCFNVVCRALRVKNDEFFSPIASGIISSCLILNIILYARIFRIIRRHEQQIHTQTQVLTQIQSRDNRLTTLNNQTSSLPLPQRVREAHMARTVAYITGILVLCYSPLMFTSLADVVVKKDALFDHLLYPVAETIAFLNSAINPFVYCWRCRDIREKILLYLKAGRRPSVSRAEIGLTQPIRGFNREPTATNQHGAILPVSLGTN